MELYAAVWFMYESIIDIASEVLAACASGTTCDIVRGGGGGGDVQRCGTRGERTYSSQKAGLPQSKGPLLTSSSVIIKGQPPYTRHVASIFVMLAMF